jgi:hypothetical protein
MDLEQKAIERIRIASEMSLHHYGEPLERICGLPEVQRRLYPSIRPDA